MIDMKCFYQSQPVKKIRVFVIIVNKELALSVFKVLANLAILAIETKYSILSRFYTQQWAPAEHEWYF